VPVSRASSLRLSHRRNVSRKGGLQCPNLVELREHLTKLLAPAAATRRAVRERRNEKALTSRGRIYVGSCRPTLGG
jgi:hypothetical protein